MKNQVYYTPLHRGRTRQLSTRYVALYSPKESNRSGAVTHVAKVTGLRVVARNEIATPWKPRSPDEPQVWFELDPVIELPRPIVNVQGSSGRAQRVSTPRWTSSLGLRRATTMPELLLETEPEWRLYESLVAAGAPFEITRSRAEQDPTDQFRAWFNFGAGRTQYRGSAGFRVEIGQSAVFLIDPRQVAGAIASSVAEPRHDPS